MKVDNVTLQTLFSKPVRYQIPTFQRPYVWRKGQQWVPLWDDVRNTTENHLDIGIQSKPHFLGAVVLQQQSHSVAALETRLVIDGQQRLTTMQLLLDAVQEVFEQRDLREAATRLSFLVLNNDAFLGKDENNAFKVWPTLNDRDAFRHAMHNGLPIDGYQDSLIVQAHEFFKLEIEHWLDEIADETEARVEALEQTVSSLLQMVVIDLDMDDEPHVIFETLNARGTPLLQSDLVKNMILFEADKADIESASEDAQRLWGFTDKWWRREIGRGRLRQPRIDIFLNHWLTMRMRRDVAPDRVSALFRQYVDESGASIEAIAADLAAVGETYRNLEERRYSEFEAFLYRRNAMQTGTITPVLLWLFSSGVPDEQRKKAVCALESYLVRRMVCRMTTKDYNNIFLGLVSALDAGSVYMAGNTVTAYLGGQTAHSRIWPDDATVQQAFLTEPLYWSLTQGRLRLVLEGIEEELISSMAGNQSAPRDLTIEHIMPQAWRQNWPLPADVEDVLTAGGNRNRIIHSIGNLTLLYGKLNTKLSNAAWTDKRTTLGKHDNLFLNKTLLDRASDVWDESAIAERAEEMCKAAVKVWPSAEAMLTQG